MRYLLDTNIISEVTKAEPSQHVLQWMAAQDDRDLYLSSLTIAEIWRGILEKPDGKAKDRLSTWFHGSEGPAALFAGRILFFCDRAALSWAKFMADGRKAGRPRSALDMIIAAVADVNDCVVVTRNEKDFAGLKFFNPQKS